MFGNPEIKFEIFKVLDFPFRVFGWEKWRRAEFEGKVVLEVLRQKRGAQKLSDIG